MTQEEIDKYIYLKENKTSIEDVYNKLKNSNFVQEKHRLQEKEYCDTLLARDYKDPKCVIVPENTKKGYTEAYEGDEVYINRPHQKRGVVQKGLIQTLKTSCNDVGVVVKVGNYSPSGHNAATIVDGCGIAPTVMEIMEQLLLLLKIMVYLSALILRVVEVELMVYNLVCKIEFTIVV
jgi:hypothetical protein